MRYMELLVIMFLLSTFGIFVTSTIGIYKRLFTENAKILDETSACLFISQSFKNTCDGTGFDSLYQWQKSCKSMWNLKYIAWCDARDFLPIPGEYEKKVLYGKWIGENWEGEVYWEVEK